MRAWPLLSLGSISTTVVPVDEPLIAEVQVKNQDIGFITPRQTARVKIAAFPFQKYGMLDGEVLHMGADSTDTASGRTEEINPESRLGAFVENASHYKARIKLSEQRLRRGEGNNEQHTLLPGMQVVAEMKLGERTVLEYLLSPVAKVAHFCLRKRGGSGDGDGTASNNATTYGICFAAWVANASNEDTGRHEYANIKLAD